MVESRKIRFFPKKKKTALRGRLLSDFYENYTTNNILSDGNSKRECGSYYVAGDGQKLFLWANSQTDFCEEKSYFTLSCTILKIHERDRVSMPTGTREIA